MKFKWSAILNDGFVISLFLTIAFIFLITKDSQWTLLIIGVIFFHELGHCLAMDRYGYSDLQIRFTLFGGLASGVPDTSRQTTFSESVILLAGPVPGILLGLLLGCLISDESPVWLHTLVFTLILINGLNLLPIGSLDGGRLLRLNLEEHHRLLTLLIEAFFSVYILIAGIFNGFAIFAVVAGYALYELRFRFSDYLDERKSKSRKEAWLAKVGSDETLHHGASSFRWKGSTSSAAVLLVHGSFLMVSAFAASGVRVSDFWDGYSTFRFVPLQIPPIEVFRFSNFEDGNGEMVVVFHQESKQQLERLRNTSREKSLSVLVYDEEFGDEELKGLKDFKVRSLSIMLSAITRDGWQFLPRTIEKLHLGEGKRGIELVNIRSSLPELRNLNELWLSVNKGFPLDFSPNQFPRLNSLSVTIEGEALKRRGVKDSTATVWSYEGTPLKLLDLRGGIVTDLLLEKLEKMPGLRILSLNNSKFEVAKTGFISSLGSKELSIVNSSVRDRDLAGLLTTPGGSLTLNSCPAVRGNFLARLSLKRAIMRKLEIDARSLTARSLRLISRLRLRNLTIRNWNGSNVQDLKMAIRHGHRLKSLTLSNVKDTAAVLETLPTSITTLSLYDKRVTGKDLRKLSRYPKLSEVYGDSPNFTKGVTDPEIKKWTFKVYNYYEEE